MNEQLLSRLMAQYGEAVAELYRAFPHGRPLAGQDRGWIDRHNQIVEARQAIERLYE